MGVGVGAEGTRKLEERQPESLEIDATGDGRNDCRPMAAMPAIGTATTICFPGPVCGGVSLRILFFFLTDVARQRPPPALLDRSPVPSLSETTKKSPLLPEISTFYGHTSFQRVAYISISAPSFSLFIFIGNGTWRTKNEK